MKDGFKGRGITSDTKGSMVVVREAILLRRFVKEVGKKGVV